MAQLAGTYEITGVSGASSTGLTPTDMIVYNGEVLFNGLDADDAAGLWVTDGTGAGTHEIAVAGADASGLNPTDMTVYNGEVLFAGKDASGHIGLWVTDGTTSGTHELTGITNGYASGIDPSDLTVFDGKVLFAGSDAPLGRRELWVTDGTAAGTHEITSSGSSTYQFNPSNFEVYGDELLFAGTNSSNYRGLWSTDGTSAGTGEISPIAGTRPNYGLSPVDLVTLTSPASGGSILFQNTGGQAAIWEMDGPPRAAAGLSPESGSSWTAVGTGDFGGGRFRHPVAEHERAGRDLENGRDHPDRRRGRDPQSGVELESGRNRRLQRRRAFRHPVAEHERAGRDLDDERRDPDRRRRRDPQSGSELESGRNRRLQRRRPFRHRVAERQRAGRDLGDEREHCRSAAESPGPTRDRAGS